MDDRTKRIQARLRDALSESLTLDAEYAKTPIVTFEEVAVRLESPRTIIADVRRELEGRGYRVAHINHPFVKGTSDELSLAERIAALDDGYDVLLGEGFGYMTVPKFLVTDRVQEGFNLGLPNVIGFISGQDFAAMIPKFDPTDTTGIADMIERSIIRPRTTQTTQEI